MIEMMDDREKSTRGENVRRIVVVVVVYVCSHMRSTMFNKHEYDDDLKCMILRRWSANEMPFLSLRTHFHDNLLILQTIQNNLMPLRARVCLPMVQMERDERESESGGLFTQTNKQTNKQAQVQNESQPVRYVQQVLF